MTIAIAVKVTDGLVLAADSATTIGRGDSGNVYNNAEKVFHFHKRARLGSVMWGLGTIRGQTITALFKDLRERFTNGDKTWKVDPSKYTVGDVAKKVQQFLYSERYRPWCEESKDFPKDKWPPFGMLIGGYSSGADLAEVWRLDFIGGEPVLKEISGKDYVKGVWWGGDALAVQRLMLGFDPYFPVAILNAIAKELQLEGDDAEPKAKREKLHSLVDEIAKQLEAEILSPGMPIQDAIDLAYFLVDTAAKFSRYTPGYQTIGGPIDIAAITKHEGFKWVRRKHYYDPALNSKS